MATLRNWEKRYSVVVPARNGGGQRLYSREQIAQLRLLKRWIGAGLSAAEAHERLQERVAPRRQSIEAAKNGTDLDSLRARAAAVRAEARASVERLHVNAATRRSSLEQLRVNAATLVELATSLDGHARTPIATTAET